MSRLSIKKTGSKIIVINKLSYPEAINERELNALSAGLMNNVLTVVSEKKRKDVLIKCTAVSMVPLNTYFAGIVSKKMFLDVISQLASLVKKCENNLMNANNLCLSMDYIFVNPHTREVNCIFWPVVNNQIAQNPSVFFGELPFSLVFSKHEDASYVNDYIGFFKTNNPFSISGFERFIYELSGKMLSNTRMPSGPTSDTNGYKKTSEPLSSLGESGNIAYDPLRNVAKAKESSDDSVEFTFETGLQNVIENLSVEKQNDLVTLSESAGTTVLGESGKTKGTTVLGSFEDNEVLPHLIREKTGQIIYINKPRFVVGKNANADGVVLGNTAISGTHAEIITHDERYFIVDKKSTNKTYVDGKVLPPNEEFEVFSGMVIKLADEEFVFNL